MSTPHPGSDRGLHAHAVNTAEDSRPDPSRSLRSFRDLGTILEYLELAAALLVVFVIVFAVMASMAVPVFGIDPELGFLGD